MSDDPVVAFIAAQPGAADRLLVRHVDDGTGHCRACWSATRGDAPRWPCSLHIWARRAQDGASPDPRSP